MYKLHLLLWMARSFFWQEKYCFTHRMNTHAREEQIPIQEVYLVSKEKIITLSHRKNISCGKAKWKILPVAESILHVMHTVLPVIGGTSPVTWWNIPMSQKILPVKERIPPVTKGVWISVTEGFFPVKERIYLVTGIKSRHGCMAEWNLKCLPKS